MYEYEWDSETGGFLLTKRQKEYVAQELRPVYAEELRLYGLDKYFRFNTEEKRPFMWAIHQNYYYRGEKIVSINNVRLGGEPQIECSAPGLELQPVDVALMLEKNAVFLEVLRNNAQARVKEMYAAHGRNCDVAYISFSGGKDSLALLNLCHEVLPLDCPVVFCDTDMELPDTYKMWEAVQKLYPQRRFITARADRPALENWRLMGPPSRSIRWCCAVHKSTPALLALREYLHKTSLRALAFVGVRHGESLKRASYDDVGLGIKNSSQINAMPILEWGAQELFLYLFAAKLPVHRAYRYGLARVGCCLCPESSEKHLWLVDKIYEREHLLAPYQHIIEASYAKTFESESDKLSFFSAGWQTRKSGSPLKESFVYPSENYQDNCISWKILSSCMCQMREWCKTIGDKEANENIFVLKANGTKWQAQGKIIFDSKPTSKQCRIICAYDEVNNVANLASSIRQIYCKAIACVSCRVCESECPTGALRFFNGFFQIDDSKCVHCLRCHNVDYGCWRFKSMINPKSNSSSLKSANNYKTFGLRLDWVQILLAEKENFSHSTQFGTQMLPAAYLWFKQAKLLDSQNMPTNLLKVADKFGSNNDNLWDMIWFALVNNSILMKWYVCTAATKQICTIPELSERMLAIEPTVNVKGPFSSLKDTVRRSPIGLSEHPLVRFTAKGKTIDTLQRLPHPITNLTLLYCYYLMAELTGRDSFTVSQMMNPPELTSAYISPLAAFGLQPDELKAQSRGLASRYPSFIKCNFTLDLDEIFLFPREKSLDDVISLILDEGN